MKFLITLCAISYSITTFALDSEIKFSTDELNKNQFIASGGTDITDALRVLQLQLRNTGCDRPGVISPDMYETKKSYSFKVNSDNCVVIPKADKCEDGFSPRNMKGNRHDPTSTTLGVDKYKVCLKTPKGSLNKSSKAAQ